MKIFLFIFLLPLFLFAQTDSIVVLDTENFSLWLPTGWTVLDLAGAAPANHWFPLTVSGDTAAAITYSGDRSDDWLITPILTLSSLSDSIMLSYWQHFSHWATEAGSSFVMFSHDNGATWTDTLVIYPKAMPSDDQLGDTTIHIETAGPFTGNEKIAFWYNHRYGNYWYIDNVRIVQYMSEPVPPEITHDSYYRAGMPYYYAAFPETIYIYDMTGLDSAYVCYDVDSTDSFTCVAMNYTGSDPDRVGLWAGSIPIQPVWSRIRYFFYARDSYFADPSVDSTDTFEFIVQGEYYTFDNTDSDPERPDTAWVDIETMGAYRIDDSWTLAIDDSAIALPFTFRFYGIDYDTVFVHMSGFLRFGGLGTIFDPKDNQNFPDPIATGPNGLIAGMWSEFLATATNGGDVWIYDSDDDTFIVLYDTVAWIYPGGGILDNVITMEIILISPSICSEPGNNGEIIIRYKELNDDTVLYHCTVGVENETGELGTTYLYDYVYSSDAAGIENGRAIKFTSTPPLYFGTACVVQGTADLRGTPAPGDSGLYIELINSDLTVYSRTNGFYEFLGVPPGQYFVRGRLPGYNYDASPLFNIAEGETIFLDTLFVTPITAPNKYIADFEFTDEPGIATGVWQCGEFDINSFSYSTIPPLANPPFSAHSGTRMWGTMLNSEYPNDANGFLVFPTIPTMVKFWHYYETENSADGGQILYSEDYGKTWLLAHPVDGYDDSVHTLSDSGFTGSSGGWIQDSVNLNSTNATDIGFVFVSDNSTTYSGWYLDDVFVVNLNHSYGIIQGYVYNSADYAGISDAIIIAGGTEGESDGTGFYRLNNVVVGNYDIEGDASGFIPTLVPTIVGKGDTVIENIPLTRIGIEPTGDDYPEWDFNYGTNDTLYLTITNPTDDTIDIFADLIDDTTSFPELAIIDSIDITGVSSISTPMAIGCRGKITGFDYWITSVNFVSGNRFNVQFNLDGMRTGVLHSTLSYTGFTNLPGDMAYDGQYMWQTVPEAHTIYAWDANTGVVVDSIVAPVGSGWDNPDVLVWGLAYDLAGDVFYLGDTLGKIWKVAGKSWTIPGDSICSWQVFQPSGGNYEKIYGLAFDPQRRTIWAYGSVLYGILAELDPDCNSSNIRIISQTDIFSDYEIHSLDISYDHKLWGVFYNTVSGRYQIYAIGNLLAGAYPVGVGIYPHSLEIAGGESGQIAIFTGASTPAGIYPCTLSISTVTDDYSFSEPLEYPLNIVVSKSLNFGWNLISVPVQPNSNDPYTMLSDDIVPFFNEPTHTNIYAWDPERGMYVVPDTFARNNGYFLFAWHNNTYFDIPGVPYYDAYTITMPYYETSLYPGWYLVGNPVNYAIDWNQIVNGSGFSGLMPIYYTLTGAGWGSYSPGFPAGASRFIQPYTGFFVVVYPDMTGVLPIGTNSFIPVMAKMNAINSDLPDFTFRFDVFASDDTAKWNYLGTRADADDDFGDRYDAEIPPNPIGKNNIVHFINNSDKLMRDVRRTLEIGESKIWTFAIDNITDGETVTIHWNSDHEPDDFDCSQGLNQIGANFDFDLLDMRTGTHIDMCSTDHYTFAHDGSRTFNITVSAFALDASEQTKPDRYRLIKNTPNPFNSATAIGFGIPDRCEVSLDILDISGRVVRNLAANEFDSGWHKIIWDGTNDFGENVPSGVYLYRLRAGDFTAMKKMVLLK